MSGICVDENALLMSEARKLYRFGTYGWFNWANYSGFKDADGWRMDCCSISEKIEILTIEGSQMLFYVWFEFTSWLRGVGQGKGAWDCFLTIWAWDSCAFCQWDQWLLRDWTFILQMTLSWPDVDSLGLLPSALMFCLNLKKSLLQSWL